MNRLLEKLEALEPKHRWLICGLTVVLLAGIGYYLHSLHAGNFDTLSLAVEDMRQSVQKHQAVAVRLDELNARLTALDDALKVAIALLPETREIPELLTQISQLGLNAGLEFRLFKPEAERPADFYAEVPVSLAILGFFHDVARFFDHLSKLSRIVNVTDIKISLAKGRGEAYTLATNCLLTTFRFLEPQESAGKKGAPPPSHEKDMCPMPRIMLVMMAIGMGAMLTACGVEEPTQTGSPPLKRRQEVKQPALQALSPTPDEEPYFYDTSSRRDPFRPLLESAQPPDAGATDQANCPPTQEFELASLKLVAIVWGDMGRKAMLKAPNGRGYAVTEDMLIGRNCGRIRRIDSTAVVIEETRRDTEGRVLKEEVVLRLREREG